MKFPHPEPERLYSEFTFPHWMEKPVLTHKYNRRHRVSPDEDCENCRDAFAWNRRLDNSTWGHAKREWEKNQRKLASITGSNNRRARMKEAFVENVVAARVFRRDKWICGICGTAVSQLNDRNLIDIASLDHIIPISKGGEHSYANTQLAHLSCNLSKGAKTPKL